VRQWRQEALNMAPPPPVEMTRRNDRWAIEFPFGLPRDWQLLPPHSQELLKAARSGRMKRPLAVEEDEAEAEGLDGGKTDKKEEGASGSGGADGIMVRVWKQIPRNVEGAGVSHLAKRRKNTITLPTKVSVALAPAGATVTRATVRRVDAAGNPYEQTITLQDGQTIDGEIISTTLVPVLKPEAGADAPATHAHTPAKRRPPPPKRKAKGPGRGRKKGVGKLVGGPAVPPVPGAPGAAPANGATEAKPMATDPDVSHDASPSRGFGAILTNWRTAGRKDRRGRQCKSRQRNGRRVRHALRRRRRR
jgi:hypothetical protein